MDTLGKIQDLVARVLNRADSRLSAAASLAESGLDSLSLLILREECEKTFGIFITDAEWMETGTVAQLVNLINSQMQSTPGDSSDAAPSNTAGQLGAALLRWNADDMAESVEIGMPLMGIGNLCENAFLKYLGDVRWRHITHLTGIPSRQLVDDAGNRLYPAFFYVELRFPKTRPMSSFGENDTLMVMDTVRRYGGSVLDGTVYLIPPESLSLAARPLSNIEEALGRGIPAVRMSNAFVMKFDGAEWLKRSRPKDGILDNIAELPGPPDSLETSKSVQAGARLSAPVDGYFALHQTETPYTYPIQPDRDVNGVGLLYFANYPLFLDLAERHALQTESWPDSLINTRSLFNRRIVYLNNAAWHDSLDIRTRCWVKGSPELDPEGGGRLYLITDQRIFRKSDGRMMCVGWSEKAVTGSIDDLRAIVARIGSVSRPV